MAQRPREGAPSRVTARTTAAARCLPCRRLAGSLPSSTPFSGRKDGGLPFSPMILAPNGALYGTTTIGGGAGFGTIFQIVFAN